jgi:transketolase
MRRAFIRTLAELAEADSNIMLITGDLGYTVLEPFMEKFPHRFLNAGVAEQNMVGMATGLAEAGFIPFVYSIAPFATLRPYEFIRNGPILHRFPVRIVGTGGGFEYGLNSITHFGLEDIGVMRIQPAIHVIVPADHEQTCNALRATWDLPGPIYYRIGKDDVSTVPGLNGRFELECAQQISEGDELLIITAGSVAKEVAAAARDLSSRGTHCAVIVVATLNPPPLDDLAAILSRFRMAITVENHYVVGGLGSLVSEIVAEQGIECKVRRCGVRTMPSDRSGSQAYLNQKHGLSKERLVESILEFLNLGSRKHQ